MAATDKSLLRYDGTMGVNARGEPVRIATRDSWATEEADRMRRHNESMAGHKRLVRFGQIASVAPLAFAAAPAVASGGFASVPGAVGASAAPLGAGTVTGAAAGGGMTLGHFLNLANLGIGSASSLFGMRSNNRALDRQMALQQQEMSARMAAEAEARAEARRQFDAMQANETRRFAADDEDRAYNRRLIDDREARLAPYRAMADRARMRLASFLGL